LSTIAGPGRVEETATLPHNTRCGTIYNDSGVPYNVVCLESNNGMGIPSGGNRDFAGEIIPWCENGTQITTDAFIFRSGGLLAGTGTGRFYIFQRWPAPNRIQWTVVPASGGIPFWPGTPGAAPADTAMVNIRILSNNTPAIDRAW
jgi:hypothetical protein